MDISIILKTKIMNIIRNTKRTIDKLFYLHKQNKIIDFNNKIDKLKDLIDKNIEKIVLLQSEINKRANYDKTIFSIVEYFFLHRCYQSGILLSTKYNLDNDLDFYKEQQKFEDECKNDNYESLLVHLKEYKYFFKSEEIDKNIKIKYFLHLCSLDKIDECINVLRNNDIPKKYWIYIVSPQNCQFEKEVSYEVLLNAFGICISRLQKRIEYGIISYKTKMCYKETNTNCPSCMFLKLQREVPFNKREHSVILCKGTNEPISEVNKGMVYENGNVYGEKYVKQKMYRLENNKYPRDCYFM